MALRLVIAEKPSVAQTIAAALGVKEKKDGYIAVSYTHLDVYKRQAMNGSKCCMAFSTRSAGSLPLIFHGLPRLGFPQDRKSVV